MTSTSRSAAAAIPIFFALIGLLLAPQVRAASPTTRPTANPEKRVGKAPVTPVKAPTTRPAAVPNHLSGSATTEPSTESHVVATANDGAHNNSAIIVPALATAAESQAGPSDQVGAPASGEFSYVVPFRLGVANFALGDNIVIRQILGTSSRFAPGNRYQITGTYQLSSRFDAILTTNVTTRYASGRMTVHNTRLKIQQGEGNFTVVLEMSGDQWPHMAFYPIGGGESFGNQYYGTGDTVLLQNWGPGWYLPR
jgi:hypothetical protein